MGPLAYGQEQDYSKGCTQQCNQAFNDLFDDSDVCCHFSCHPSGSNHPSVRKYTCMTSPDEFDNEKDLSYLREYLYEYAEHYYSAHANSKGDIDVHDCPNYKYIKSIVDKKLGKKRKNSADLKQ